jgi:hypothetical protein
LQGQNTPIFANFLYHPFFFLAKLIEAIKIPASGRNRDLKETDTFEITILVRFGETTAN